MKESDVRPREIPSPKDSVFLADMRSRQESSRALREPGANFLEGVENDVRSTENSQNESHSQNHLDERMTPHLSIQDNIPMCQECGRDSSECPRRLSAGQTNDDCNSTSVAPKISNINRAYFHRPANCRPTHERIRRVCISATAGSIDGMDTSEVARS